VINAHSGMENAIGGLFILCGDMLLWRSAGTISRNASFALRIGQTISRLRTLPVCDDVCPARKRQFPMRAHTFAAQEKTFTAREREFPFHG
jgi:hypothetical protein